MESFTRYLYAKPSFIEGFSRLIDFGGTLQQYNTSLSGNQADALAIYSDWLTIGADLHNAMNQYDFDIDDSLIKQARKELGLD